MARNFQTAEEARRAQDKADREKAAAKRYGITKVKNTKLSDIGSGSDTGVDPYNRDAPEPSNEPVKFDMMGFRLRKFSALFSADYPGSRLAIWALILNAAINLIVSITLIITGGAAWGVSLYYVLLDGIGLGLVAFFAKFFEPASLWSDASDNYDFTRNELYFKISDSMSEILRVYSRKLLADPKILASMATVFGIVSCLTYMVGFSMSLAILPLVLMLLFAVYTFANRVPSKYAKDVIRVAQIMAIGLIVEAVVSPLALAPLDFANLFVIILLSDIGRAWQNITIYYPTNRD